MNFDLINGGFEIMGALAILFNIFKIIKDKEVKGVSIIPMVFFTLWGIWNLYYYPNLKQIWSFMGALFLVINNCVYIILMLYFTKLKEIKYEEKR